MEKTEMGSLQSAAEAEAAAMGDMVRESLQGAAEAEAAAMEDIVGKEILQGAAEAEAAAMGETRMARNVWVAEVATEEGMAESSPATKATKVAETAAHLEVAAESSSTGGGSEKTAAHLEAAAESSSTGKGVIHLPCACFVQSREILNLVFRVLFTVEMDLDLAARAIHLLRPL